MKRKVQITSKDVLARIAKNGYYSEDSFISDMIRYCKLLKQGSIIFNIAYINRYGDSRIVQVKSLQRGGLYGTYTLGSFAQMFGCMGFKMSEKHHSSFVVRGGQINGVFEANYRICDFIKDVGVISYKEFNVLVNSPLNVM